MSTGNQETLQKQKETLDLIRKEIAALDQKTNKTLEDLYRIGELLEMVFVSMVLGTKRFEAFEIQRAEPLGYGFDFLVGEALIDVKGCKARQYGNKVFIERYQNVERGTLANHWTEQLDETKKYYLAYCDWSADFCFYFYSVRTMRSILQNAQPVTSGGQAFWGSRGHSGGNGHKVKTETAQYAFRPHLEYQIDTDFLQKNLAFLGETK